MLYHICPPNKDRPLPEIDWACESPSLAPTNKQFQKAYRRQRVHRQQAEKRRAAHTTCYQLTRLISVITVGNGLHGRRMLRISYLSVPGKLSNSRHVRPFLGHYFQLTSKQTDLNI